MKTSAPDVSDTPAAPRGPGRPPCAEARHAVLAATRELLREKSYDALSVDGVAARSGVPKSTIYRHWSSKAELAVEAFLEEVGEHVALKPEPTLRDTMARQLRALCRFYRSDSGRFFHSVVAAAQGDEQVRTALWSGFIERRRAATAERVRAAQAAGEITGDLDVEVLMDLFYSPVMYRLLLTGKVPTERSLDAQLALIFDGAATRGR